MRSTTHPTLRLALGLLAATALCSAPGSAQERAATGPAHAQRAEAPRSTDGGEAGADDSTRELRRILVLHDGRAVRAVTRKRDGAWEYKVDGRWLTIDERAIASTRLEKDVLREAREREQALGASAGERVAYAGWLAQAGLVIEALETLDRVLEDHPHDRAALELLASRRWIEVPSLAVDPEELPAAKESLYQFANKAPRAGRELAILALSGVEDREALRGELKSQLGDSVVRRRAFAAQALGRLFKGEEAKSLLVHAVLDSSEEVRRESSFALSAVEEPGLIVPVVRALSSSDARVRTQAAEALGNMGYAAAVEPLVNRLSTIAAQGSGAGRVPHANIFIGKQFAYIQDFDVEVAQFQAVADPQVNVLIEGSVLDAGVHSTQHFAFAYESKVIRGALANLTGENPGFTSRSWLSWWDENQARWRAPSPPATRAGS